MSEGKPLEIVKIGKDGQMVIPEVVLRVAEIREGDLFFIDVEINQEDGKIIITMKSLSRWIEES